MEFSSKQHEAVPGAGAVVIITQSSNAQSPLLCREGSVYIGFP